MAVRLQHAFVAQQGIASSTFTPPSPFSFGSGRVVVTAEDIADDATADPREVEQLRRVDASPLAQAVTMAAPSTGPAANLPLTDSSTQQHVTSEHCTEPNHNTAQTSSLSPHTPHTPPVAVAAAVPKRSLRKISPRLLERLHLLGARKRSSASVAPDEPAVPADQAPAPGRIPDVQTQLLDDFHRRNRQIVVDKRGTACSGGQTTSAPPRLALDLDVGALCIGEAFLMATTVHESDASSIISVSDRLMPSDSEPEPDPHTDTQKYRLPDFGKARGSSRDGFVLEDGTVMDRDKPPTPPPKDMPLAYDSPLKEDHYPYFNPGNLSRTASIYTLSRASFSNQISQLTSIKLPAATSLASSIAAIPTSSAAARALNDASGQIRIWMAKVTEVLEGLDAEDDIEWAAAGGRDGLGDVDTAINRFEGLIDVYVGAIEQLETRNDISSLDADDLQGVVDRMERILKDWAAIKDVLQGVKEQVELAMEWEELWNTVLGEIGQEMEALSRLIFEMEERRHRGILDAMAEPGKILDINELETIIEEAPSRSASVAAHSGRHKEDTIAASPQPQQNDEDKNLVSLFARMQPLRASLDFFPMRLSAFVQRARKTFPTGCEELEKRLEYLEAKFQKIDADAESLRKELGEDRWVIIFRKASEKALRMSESVDRSILKLREALEDGVQHTNPAALAKKLESYEAKKEHYGPAIQQVLGIIDKGVQTRLTVNGEILRLQADMKRRWMELEANIKGMDFAVEQLQVSKIHHQLRDSISTILSEQRSVTSSMVDTPGSSPASSVVLLSRQSSDQGVSTPYAKSRAGSFASSTTARSNAGKRLSSLPTSLASSSSAIPRKTPLLRSSVADLRPGAGISARLYSTPTPSRSFSRTESRAETARPDKPRWNSSTNLNDTPLGHNFKPLSATTPSPYKKGISPIGSPRSMSSSYQGHPSPLGPGISTSGLRPPSALGRRPPSALALNKTASAASAMPKLRQQQSVSALPTRPGPTPIAQPPQSGQRTVSHIPRASVYGSIPGTPTSNYAPSTASTSSTATIVNHSRNPSTPMSHQDETELGTDADIEASPTAKRSTARPGTSQAGRRVSMLPQPKRVASGHNDATAAAVAAMNGRTSRTGIGRRTSMAFGTASNGDDKPRWRGA